MTPETAFVSMTALAIVSALYGWYWRRECDQADVLIRRLDNLADALILERKNEKRLESAAPDMLDALERLYKHCSMIHTYWGESGNEKEAQAAIAAGLAAMKKAKGE